MAYQLTPDINTLTGRQKVNQLSEIEWWRYNPMDGKGMHPLQLYKEKEYGSEINISSVILKK